MNKILLILVPATLVLSLMYMVPSSEFILLQQHKSAYAQVISQDNNNTNTTAATASNTTTTSTDLLSSVHPDIDSSPIASSHHYWERYAGKHNLYAKQCDVKCR